MNVLGVDAPEIGVLIKLSNVSGGRRLLGLEESMESRNDCSNPWVGPGCSSFGNLSDAMLAVCGHPIGLKNSEN